ncbi:MAG: ATP-dependent RNA helicase DbpA [Pseudomonadales bacterium]|nr:ATP-dependent RNA helicase DbpA [Pseudomonadales bacterium]
MPLENDFANLELSSGLLENLKTLGYEQMTPIQAQSLPVVLRGQDIRAQAKTGSGKTAAFGLGLLAKLNPDHRRVQALVLCPTRELADQVSKEIRRLAQGIPNVKLVSLCGGKPFGPQKGSLQHGAHIAVGTPGRVLDHLSKNTLRLDNLLTLVLDEADRMLDMGFADDMQQIIQRAPTARQTLLFSATYPASIQTLSRRIQKDPATVVVESQHKPGTIEQLFYEVKKHERNNTLLALFEHYQPESTIVFCHTKIQCAEVAQLLTQNKISALAIHGDLEQRERDRVLIQFANGSCPVLVGTDVAARGLDIKSLTAVINYELPHDPEVYVHRIGRTGRAGATGLALSIATPGDMVRVKAIEEFTNEPAVCDVYESLNRQDSFKIYGHMTTLEINAGRKSKIRPGDVLGSLTGDAGLPGSVVGKIDIFEQASFVAIENSAAAQALEYLDHGRLKGRTVRARRLSD